MRTIADDHSHVIVIWYVLEYYLKFQFKWISAIRNNYNLYRMIRHRTIKGIEIPFRVLHNLVGCRTLFSNLHSILFSMQYIVKFLIEIEKWFMNISRSKSIFYWKFYELLNKIGRGILVRYSFVYFSYIQYQMERYGDQFLELGSSCENHFTSPK